MNPKDLVRRKFPNARAIRCYRGWKEYTELWSEGIGKGILLAEGRSRKEAFEKAAKKIDKF